MAKILTPMPKSDFILSCIACRKNETVFFNFLTQDFGWKSCISEKKTHEEHWSGKLSKIITTFEKNIFTNISVGITSLKLYSFFDSVILFPKRKRSFCFDQTLPFILPEIERLPGRYFPMTVWWVGKILWYPLTTYKV